MALPNRACDLCKRRKVKCDTEKPCANCRISQLSCEYRIPTKRRGRRPNKTPHPPMDGDGNDKVHSSPRTPQHVAELHTPLLSPASTVHSICTPSLFSIGISHDVSRIYTDLLGVVNGIVAPTAISELVHHCIDLFMQYLFPNMPIAHEPTLRAAVSLFSYGSHAGFIGQSTLSDMKLQLAYLRPFTLITALCAFVTSAMPKSLVSLQAQLVAPFLQSSLAMLKLYESYDLGNPDSTSLTIRIWHSAASQNMTGKLGTAHHYHGEATLLSLRLNLHDETAVQRDSAVESQLLRLNFWQLYCADKSAAALETRNPVLNDFTLSSNFSLLEHGIHDVPLLAEGQQCYEGPLEQRLLIGFHLRHRIWSLTSDLVVGIKSYVHRKKWPANKDAKLLELAQLAEAYMVFAGIVDEIPTWLRYLHASSELTDDDVSKYHRTCFWTQRSNIMTVFHCSKIVILEKCIRYNIPSVMGLDENQSSWAIRSLEIARDFLYELKIVPFICLKVLGEAAVERIRRVGSILLQLAHNAINGTIKAQADSIFTQILEILTKLDSKASDELNEEKA